MTELNKPIKRETAATQFDRSEHRRIIVSIEPSGRDNATVGVRLKGTRLTYRVGVNSIFNLAVQHHINRIEKRARELYKTEKLPMRTARARARKELAKKLK